MAALDLVVIACLFCVEPFQTHVVHIRMVNIQSDEARVGITEDIKITVVTNR